MFEAEPPHDREAEEEEAGSGGDERDGVEDDGEGVQLFLKDPGGEEGEEGEREEKDVVGVKDAGVDFFDAADELVVVNPVDGGEGEGEEIDEEDGEDRAEAGDAVCAGHLEFEHHDGDDDGDDAVGKGFETGGWGGGRHEARSSRAAYIGGCGVLRRRVRALVG